MQRKQRRESPKISPSASRASVSFPSDLYQAIEHIARQKKVSVAWVVRDAAEKYINSLHPLFEEKKSP